MTCFDIHTHQRPKQAAGAIFSCLMTDSLPREENVCLSVGIHPWYLSEDNVREQYKRLVEVVGHPQVVAIGECGLDKLKGPSLALQQDVFKQCALLAEQTSLPLIIHAVKCSNELIRLKKELNPSLPWIIHGFRGKKEVAQAYLKHGFYLSFGEHYQEEALRIVPLDKLFLETDESLLPIESIYQKAAHTLAMPVEELANQVTKNLCTCFTKRRFLIRKPPFSDV